MKPLAIELFCGCFGGTAGWLEAGGYSVGFDLQHEHYHGKVPAGAELVLQDVLTLHGSQFKDASYIWASPPCQNYSYLAMPWSRSTDPENSKAAKALRKKWETEGPDNRLFDACFRIQREACEAAGRYIPLIVENVRGAVPWVGREKAKFGSFYLWGDVGMVGNRVFAGRDLTDVMAGRGRFGMGVAPNGIDEIKAPGQNWSRFMQTGEVSPDWKFQGAVKVLGQIQGKEYAMCRTGAHGQKTLGHVNKRDGHGHTRHLTNQAESDAVREQDGTKIGGDWFRDPACHSKHGSRSNARKAASAMIAKIPLALSRYIAEQHFPEVDSGEYTSAARLLLVAG